ncbi:protein of unassigned function [Methylobacterium oryzae CBMB20]|uniref:Protein of unassigned function n=1 Tax=Methylobacterium oryzae CBMB20 TaxID=693986 RepID=A0A089NNW5_9HYPH|nr:protein of unassigned function [Methylobacterium oryzae CBMB20]
MRFFSCRGDPEKIHAFWRPTALIRLAFRPTTPFLSERCHPACPRPRLDFVR